MFAPSYSNSATACSKNDFLVMNPMVTTITVQNGCGNDIDTISWNWNHFLFLKEIVIGNNCFKSVDELKLAGLSSLESVVIGDYCFSNAEGALELRSLRQLKSLRVGSGSMKQFKSLVVDDMSVLDSITIGSDCFRNVDEVKLIGLTALKSVTVGSYSFSDKNGGFYLKDCPLLTEVITSYSSFKVYNRLEVSNVTALERVSIGSECFKNVNELKLIGLSALKNVTVGGNCFSNGDGSFYLKDCPELRELQIEYGSFSRFRILELANVNALEKITIGSNGFAYSSLELKSIAFVFCHDKTFQRLVLFHSDTNLSLSAIALCLRVLLEGLNDVQICHCSPPFRWATMPFRSRMLMVLPW